MEGKPSVGMEIHRGGQSGEIGSGRERVGSGVGELVGAAKSEGTGVAGGEGEGAVALSHPVNSIVRAKVKVKVVFFIDSQLSGIPKIYTNGVWRERDISMGAIPDKTVGRIEFSGPFVFA